MKAVQNSVEPNSWKAIGGEATIDFTLIGMSFIVRQNEKGHSEIAKLMSDLGNAMKSIEESKEK